VDRISLLPFFLQSLPENYIILFLGLTWTGVRVGVRMILPIAIIGAGGSYFIRALPLAFGFHSLLQLILLILLVHFCLKEKWRLSIVATLLGGLAVGLAESLIDPLILFLTNLTLTELLADPWLRVLVPLPHLVVLGIIAIISVRKNWVMVDLHSDIKKHTKRASFFIVVLFQAFFLIVLNITFYVYRSGNFPMLKLPLLFTIVNIILITAFLTTIFIANKMLEITKQEVVLQERSRHIEAMQELYLTVRSQRHGFLNHVTSLYGLLKTNDYSAAQKYMETLYEDVKQSHSLMNIGIPALSGLLHTKASIARQRGIDYKIEIDPEFSAIHLSSVDLTGIIGNLLDNAIEAIPLDGPNQPQIKVELLYEKREQVYLIRVSNTNPRPSQELLAKILRPGFSTKDRAKHSGIGLSTISSITQKYSGKLGIEYNEEKSMFIVQVTIPSQAVKTREAFSYAKNTSC